MATRTQTFGAGKRESHDASDFYARFTPPNISKDETVNPCRAADQLIVGDARDMHAVDDNSVALVVTSPPYFAGKEYELALGEGGIPASYLEYLGMLRDVFAECVRVLEPGGRIAVNVANLGRKPYRSLAGDVTTILQDELALLLRGEIIWRKAKGASGSCAFGSYLKASNPVMRDVTERVIVASKGRFNRAIEPKRREAMGLPYESTISKDEFFAAAIDVWEMRPESARRVKHPAPFPVELPERLIRFHTYVGDVVLDPFLGSGSTAVAAARNQRRYVGYDTDPAYVDIAHARLEEARRAPSEAG
jgi:site-specific DNA-methyltransferase (adenine-specific)